MGSVRLSADAPTDVFPPCVCLPVRLSLSHTAEICCASASIPTKTLSGEVSPARVNSTQAGVLKAEGLNATFESMKTFEKI